MQTFWFALGLSFLAACASTSHPDAPGSLGFATRGADLDRLVDVPGPIQVETVVGADWKVPLSGMLNLDHPKAKAAHLEDRDEPIQIMFHVLRHPTRGTFLVDTGVEHALFDDPDEAAIRGLARRVAEVDAMKRHVDTKTWLAREHAPVAGVFLTHLHIDHIAGMRDLPANTPVFVGPGEGHERHLENVFVGAITDRALAGKPPLSVWRLSLDPEGDFEGMADVFGDQTLWALHVPGHTAGSMAFVARTPSGPVLLTGDACHTRWGWDHGVEPGTFSDDPKRSAISLARLRRFAAKHPTLDVRVGHTP